MKEFEMYLDKEINLPKSVLITIDDGWRTQIVEELLEEYQLNGTIFLITSWFKEIDWLNNSEYIEYHSSYTITPTELHFLENNFSIYDDFNNFTYDIAFLEYLK